MYCCVDQIYGIYQISTCICEHFQLLSTCIQPIMVNPPILALDNLFKYKTCIDVY